MKNNLRIARVRKNYTQQDLAEKIGVSRQTINSIETNRYIPSTLLALKLSRVLDSSVEQLFELEEGD
jgi:putative transcriptional regulator